MTNSQLFDNLKHTIQSRIAFNGTTLVSEEVNLDLPRGYIAHIKRVTFEIMNFVANLSPGSPAFEPFMNMALIRDPDDIVTAIVPDNEEYGEVIDGAFFDLQLEDDADANDPNAMFIFQTNPQIKEYTNLGLDVVSARNLRFNVDCDTANVDWTAACTIDYTIEKVTDEVILELLDIL